MLSVNYRRENVKICFNELEILGVSFANALFHLNFALEFFNTVVLHFPSLLWYSSLSIPHGNCVDAKRPQVQ